MSKADEIYRQTCLDILEHGFWDTDQKVRPVWEDGAPAHTVKKFGVVNRYDLREEFPIMTLRRTAFKSCVDELLWIWQKKSNNVHDLNSHIWDSWADDNGSIGKAYGYQLGQRYVHHRIPRERWSDDTVWDELKPYPSAKVDNLGNIDTTRGEVWLDQVDGVLWDLRHNPASRRIMTNIFVHKDLHEMHLQPCAYSMTFNVSGNTLNAILNQRSQDMLTANNWNVCQYAVLLHMVAKSVGLEAGELVHVIADCHIYDRHVPLVKAMLEGESHPAPKLIIDDVKDFYDFTPDSFHLEGYEYNAFPWKIPVAI